MTRQEAIYLLNNLRALDMAIEALKKQPVYEQVKWERDVALKTLEEHGIGLGQKSDWTPVSERLPNTNGIFIVTRRISDGFECRNITDACYFDGSSTWHDDTRVNHERKNLADVVAWRPLPDPYKGSEE